jgi:hypothetical protein
MQAITAFDITPKAFEFTPNINGSYADEVDI